ncbi:MAG: hypothetical protein ABWZ99_15770, partial [Ilumatobacteraceae bacterium]
VGTLMLVVAQLVVTASLTGPSAEACSCAEATVLSALADGDAAFVGAAMDREEGDATGFDMAVRWTFEVSAVVKGELPAMVDVWSGQGDGDCGAVFELGEPVGVVLRRQDDRFTTNICGGVWLPDELGAPGALAPPTGRGPVALVATGRTGDAVIASYDARGDLAAWGLGGVDDELSHLRVCPGSTVLVGMTLDREGVTRVVRRDVATLSVIGSAVVPARSADSWPQLTDNRGFECTSPDGDVAFLVSASGYDGPADNVVVFVDGDRTMIHPVEDAFAFAVAPDLGSAYLVTGPDGTAVEMITLADGTRRAFAELPDGVGGRVLAVDDFTGRLAVIGTSNPSATNRGDPSAPDDRLLTYDAAGNLLTSVELSRHGLVDRAGWLSGDRLIVVYVLPTTHVEAIGVDSTVHSSFQPDAEVTSGALAGDRLYLASADGIVSTALDGRDPRPLPLSIARVRDVVAVTEGPIAAPQQTPAVPTLATSPPSTTGVPPTTTTITTAATTSAPATVDDLAAGGPRGSGGGVAAPAVMGAVAVLATLIAVAVIVVGRRRGASAAPR